MTDTKRASRDSRKKKKISIDLHIEIYETIQKIAAKDGKTCTAVVETAVEFYIESLKAERAAPKGTNVIQTALEWYRDKRNAERAAAKAGRQ